MCGASESFPKCDGSHKKFNISNNTSLAPKMLSGGQSGAVFPVCLCGYSASGLCDDSCLRLPESEKALLLSRASIDQMLVHPGVHTDYKPRPDEKVKVANPAVYPIVLDDAKPNDKIYLCSCGSSLKFPKCDGSHKLFNKENGTQFAPVMFIVPSDTANGVRICACGYSSSAPGVCDDSHNSLSEIEKSSLIARALEWKKLKEVPQVPDVVSAEESDKQVVSETTNAAHASETVEQIENVEALSNRSMNVNILNPQLGFHVIDLKAGEKLYRCACGQSKNFPRCDGSHKLFNKNMGTSFASIVETASEDRSLYLCGCGYSKNNGLCDGTHSSLTELEKEQILAKSKLFSSSI